MTEVYNILCSTSSTIYDNRINEITSPELHVLVQLSYIYIRPTHPNFYKH